MRKILLKPIWRMGWFSISKKYKNFLSDHVIKIIESKPEQYIKCEIKLSQLLNNYPNVEAVRSENVDRADRVDQDKNALQSVKIQLNMIFRVYDMPNVLQKFKEDICDLIIKGQIKNQSDLDRITNWLLKNIKANKNITLNDIQNIKKQQKSEREQFQAQLTKLSTSNVNFDISQISKKLRQKFISIDSKQIYQKLKIIKNENSTKSCQADISIIGNQETKSKQKLKQFWDKLENIKSRLLPEQCNDPEIYKRHLQITGGRLRFRFPPEPNGYLHIGHVKSMRINFQTSKRYNGVCYLRYDDTNPQTQSQQFIDSIARNVRWLGYEPDKITFASDYFEQMINFAIELIKEGHAYVCDSPQFQIQKQRKEKMPNRFRERSIQQSLSMFPSLKEGQTLRLKLDPSAKNPTLRDPVIYRIKQQPHPRTGTKYRIYPIYDFAHCICDSLEHIDYSLCSLQFEVRRQLYYKILDLLKLYKPTVWEYSRLNVEGSVISKRKIKALIQSHTIKSWTDPRLLTIGGLINRGYTPAMVINFIDKVNASRAGNQNVVQYSLLEREMRKQLYKTAEKSMMVLNPRTIQIENFSPQDEQFVDVQVYTDPQRKQKRRIFLNKINYIQDQKQKDVYQVGKIIVLKYVGPFQILEVEDKIKIKRLKQSVKDLKQQKKQYKIVHWISQKNSENGVVYLFQRLLGPQQKINSQSKIICKNALVPKQILKNRKDLTKYWQMERLGYFKFDSDGNLIRCTTLQ